MIIMMKPQGLESCLLLNAQAILLAQLGQFEESIMFIKDALTILQPYLLHSYPRTNDANPQDNTTSRSYFSVPIISEATIQASALLSNDNLFTFYPRMFNVTEQDPSKFGPSQLFVLLAFNLAMAHHTHSAQLNTSKYNSWLAQETAESRHARLTGILKMYQSVIVAARTSVRADEVGDLLCVLTAAANNAGHLNSYMNNFSEMQTSLILERQLMGQSYGPCAIPDTDYQIFFSSIFVFLEGPGLCLSPAA
jgi:hypothetical protein